VRQAGPNSPSTVVDDASIGTVAWSNPANARVSDDSYAQAILPVGTVSHYLKATDFGLLLPPGATPLGILVEIERRRIYPVVDYRVRIVKGGNIGSAERARAEIWPTSDAYAVYGGDSDLWDETWTPGDIETLGVALSATPSGTGASRFAQVDHIRMTLYYRPPSAPLRHRAVVADSAGVVKAQIIG